MQHQSALKLPGRKKTQWGQLYGAAGALSIAELAQSNQKLTLVTTPSMSEAYHLENALRFFVDEALPIFSFPDWETLPYDLFSPHQDIVSQRLKTLYHLPNLKQGLLVLPVSTLMQRLCPPEYINQHALIINEGDEIPLDQFREKLANAGYRNVSEVNEHGEFSVRGSLLDLFPMASDRPFRLDYFDDEIESIYSFDPADQIARKEHRIANIELLPAREFPMDAEAIKRFRQNYRMSFDASRDSPIYRDISNGVVPSGIEYYMPLFMENMVSIFDYLSNNVDVVQYGDCSGAMEEFATDTAERFEQRRHDIERPVLPPEQLFLSADETTAHIKKRDQFEVGNTELAEGRKTHNFGTKAPGKYPITVRLEQPLGLLKSFLDEFEGRVLFVAESAGRREAFMELLIGNQIPVATVETFSEFLSSDRNYCISAAPLDEGLILADSSIAIICESQLTGNRLQKTRRGRRQTRDSDAVIANLADLTIGAPVVHIDHGVGRYVGLQTLDIGGSNNEYLTLTYANEDKLYVPVSSLHLISRYTGASEESAPLHRLGGEQWQKVKRRAAQKAHDVAAELLEIHARRAAKIGYAYTEETNNYPVFSETFPFEETPDQRQAIEDVVADMRSEQPMDRVVCGDVGFGKTEVAMRAAFVAIDGGKQVAILVPTTLLAHQHHKNFLDRFAEWPVQIECLSRFRSTKEQNAVIKSMQTGGVDIVIGTHKLLQKGVKYKNLGLVIIDEEHRFGVRHKEHMKSLRSEVDILTLTATPIPRTLNMGLAGLRDLSIIATPPPNRHAIKTFVGEWSDTQIKEACQRELSRGGQVYVLHNEVKSIERMANQLREIIPNATIEVAHGQMPERELESVMLDFYHQRFNILLCTTIVESGIDVPTANTIIINRADKLGLAQLHQLRGRVGRSHHRAYAYLIAPPRKSMTKDAEKRLTALESLEDLGVGFTLATHDLEIRGAGELLGDEQSGQIQEIGFTLYTQLLERAVAALKSGRLPDVDSPLAQSTEVDLGIPAILPSDYVDDVHTRLILYKRISNASDNAALNELKVELINRFGLLPDHAQNLFHSTGFKLQCQRLGATRLEAGSTGGRLVFDDNPNIDAGQLIELIQKYPTEFAFDGKNTFRFKQTLDDPVQRIEYIDRLLGKFKQPEAA
ncbi:transcription-repair coupling factor [Chromatiales bacterium (ex Bugula neritina AB1)]|nr:transcription-repair coupling factor [Chromatiales bacterium (ex Bugula neritina AB1)]